MAAPARRLQLTLALLKPDAVAHPLVCEVRAGPGRAQKSTAGLATTPPSAASSRRPCTPPSSVTASSSSAPRRCGVARSRAAASTGSTQVRAGLGGPERGAAPGRCPPGPCLSAGRFFYQRLVEFMASGPMWAYILAHENAVPLWRSLMGPTKVFRARHSDPDSIRGAYGLTDTRNTTHGSDSPASASREIAFFFPEFDEQRWYEQEEPRLRRGQLFHGAQECLPGAQPAQVQIQGSAEHHCCPCPQQCPEWICSGSCVSSHRSESCCPQCC
nr:uncharacterized protein LOC102066627 [Zonotrichia albicollis]